MRYQVFLHDRMIGQFPLECRKAAYEMANKVKGILIDTLTKQQLWPKAA